MRKLLLGLAMTGIVATISVPASASTEQDNAIAELIAGNLKSSGKMKNYEVGVLYRDGTAWLSGKVLSPQQAASAIQIARGTTGVQRVVNRLVVGGAQNQGGVATQRSNPVHVSQASAAVPNLVNRMVTHPRQIVPQQAYYQNRAAQSAGLNYVMPRQAARSNTPLAFARVAANNVQQQSYGAPAGIGDPIPAHAPGPGRAAPAYFDEPAMPNYAWPSYASHPNYGALTYPKQYSPTAWPFIGPFYPYPQVPLGWRKVTLEWDDGWWWLDFNDKANH